MVTTKLNEPQSGMSEWDALIEHSFNILHSGSG